MWRFLLAELPRLLARLALAFIGYWAVTLVPWPGELGPWVGIGASAVLVFVLLVLCGKFLYDTLFYERYWRQMDSR